MSSIATFGTAKESQHSEHVAAMAEAGRVTRARVTDTWPRWNVGRAAIAALRQTRRGYQNSACDSDKCPVSYSIVAVAVASKAAEKSWVVYRAAAAPGMAAGSQTNRCDAPLSSFACCSLARDAPPTEAWLRRRSRESQQYRLHCGQRGLENY